MSQEKHRPSISMSHLIQYKLCNHQSKTTTRETESSRVPIFLFLRKTKPTNPTKPPHEEPTTWPYYWRKQTKTSSFYQQCVSTKLRFFNRIWLLSTT